METVYEKDITENLGSPRNLILLGVRADADIEYLNKENKLLRLIMSEGSHTAKGQEYIKQLDA
jgi:hypothetical protein